MQGADYYPDTGLGAGLRVMRRINDRRSLLQPAHFVTVSLLIVMALSYPGRGVAQSIYGSDQRKYAFCIGSNPTTVYASDVFEVPTAAALQQADRDWRAYLLSVYQTPGVCHKIEASSKQAAYSALDSAAWTAQQAVNAAGQLQARQIFHIGWRAGG